MVGEASGWPGETQDETQRQSCFEPPSEFSVCFFKFVFEVYPLPGADCAEAHNYEAIALAWNLLQVLVFPKSPP